jgi:UDP-glucose 4-epimerase
MGNFYRVPADNRGLNYNEYFREGMPGRTGLREFNSNNAVRLDVEQVKEKMLKLGCIQDELAAWKAEKRC